MNASTSDQARGAAPLDPIIDEVRARFVADFSIRCDTLSSLIDDTSNPGSRVQSAQSLRATAHRLAGLAGIIGFHRVSALAAQLETLVSDLETEAAGRDAAHALVDSIRAAFAHELACPPAARPDPAHQVHRGDLLVVEDDPDQRTVLVSHLAECGYRTHDVGLARDVCGAARSLAPSVILLDIELPDGDGYSVCRELKSDPELATIPVVIMTTRSRLDDRLTGLTLGADDYLVKPLDPRELVMRIERARARDAVRAAVPPAGGIHVLRDFLQAAVAHLRRTSCALVLMRVPAPTLDDALLRVRDEIRRADLVAAYDRTHIVCLMPEMTGTAAASRTDEIVNRLIERQIENVAAGVAWSGSDKAASLESLLADADSALLQARYNGRMVLRHGEAVQAAGEPASASILVADDDPDVMRILDAGLRGTGYRTTLAFDGAEALAAMEQHRPDVLILDLMMPRIGGFEVLNRLHRSEGPHPRIIVLSARGREEDVTRAFQLGADDYVTKPFNPQELLARVARLLR